MDIQTRLPNKDVSDSTFNVENVISDSVFPKFGPIHVFFESNPDTLPLNR